jgi:hypothetical protein
LSVYVPHPQVNCPGNRFDFPARGGQKPKHLNT